MDNILVFDPLCERCHGASLGRPCGYGHISSRGRDLSLELRLVQRRATKEVLVGGEEVVIVDKALLQLIVHLQWGGREILACEHVVTDLKMRAAEGKHHGIGKQHARGVDLCVGPIVVARLVIVDVGGEDRGALLVAALVVLLNDVVEVGKILFWRSAIAVAVAPHLVIAEVDIVLHDIIGAEARDSVHDKRFLGMRRLHGSEERLIGLVEHHVVVVTVEHLATIAELVDLKAVEAEIVVNLVAAVFHVAYPPLVARVLKVDVARP